MTRHNYDSLVKVNSCSNSHGQLLFKGGTLTILP